MRRAGVAALLLLLFSPALPSAAQPASVPSLATYRRQVHSLRLSLDRVRDTGHWGAIKPLRGRLASQSRVRVPGVGIVRTDLPVLAKELAPTGTSVRLVSARIDALDDALGHGRAARADRAVLAGLDTVLRDPRFHPKCTPLACALQWAADSLLRLLRPLRIPTLAGPGGKAGLYGVLFLLLVAAAAVLLARGALSRAVVDVTERPSTAPGAGTAAAAGERARAYAERGEYRFALRYLFLSTLLTLQERGLVELRPSLTNREYLRSARPLANRADLADRFEELVVQFDRSWYGHQKVTAASYAGYEALVAEILNAAGERAA